ncbi:MAG: TIGR00725 family protein [Dehalococcoidia bacterium]|nr:MAG: TIGR00725 family protein [Dehalococcoidia bacterium]
MLEKKRLIAVIGGSQATLKELKTAEDVGRELAKRGAAVVCGGLGGVMEAACRGAASEGGVTIGILPGESRNDANQYVQIPIVTGMGYARNVAVAKSAQAVIAIGGSYGTLSEIGHAIQSDIPVIGIDTWSLSKGGEPNSSIISAENATDAVGKAFGLILD